MRTGEVPFRTHINNVGSGNYFYGDPDNGLEELLAKVDARDSTLLSAIDDTSDLTPLNHPISRMVRMLLLRTRALREKFTDTAEDLFQLLGESAQNPEIEPLIRKRIEQCFDEEFEKAWANQPPQVQMFVPKYIAKNLARTQIEKANAQEALTQAFQLVGDQLSLAAPAAGGHIRGLLKVLQQAEVEPLLEGWEVLSWRVLPMPSGSLVLGDCVVFAVRGQKAAPIAAADAMKSPTGLCMPISPCAFLVGTTDAQPIPTTPDAINHTSAVQSFDSIFSSENSETIRALMPHIGRERGVLHSDELQRIATSAWKDSDTSEKKS